MCLADELRRNYRNSLRLERQNLLSPKREQQGLSIHVSLYVSCQQSGPSWGKGGKGYASWLFCSVE